MGDHDERPVEVADLGGRLVVRKHYRNGAGDAVRAATEALWRSPFGRHRRPPGLPEPLGASASGAVLEQAYVAGPTLGDRNGPGHTEQYLDELVGLIGDLHDSGVVVARRRPAGRLLRSVQRAVGPGAATLLAALDERAAALGDERLVLCHGDCSPRNVLIGRQGLCLIDFDRVQMAGRGRDLAYFGAWCWATERVAGRLPSWRLGDALFERYADRYGAGGGGVAAELRATRAFHRSAALIRVATRWSACAADATLRQAVLDEALRQASSARC